MRRWGLAGLAAVIAVVLGGWLVVDGSPLLGAVYLVAFGAVAVLASPRAFPRSVSDAPARVTVYWRPGCPYCVRLRFALGRDARRLHWVDIWSDPAGAATVRGVTGGDETVPTVVAGERSWVNPAPALVRGLLSGHH